MGQLKTLDIAVNIDMIANDLKSFRACVCNTVQSKIAKFATKDRDKFIQDTFQILWNGDPIAVIRLDVRTKNGNITETHIWSRDVTGTAEQIDTQSASGTAFFIAGCAA